MKELYEKIKQTFPEITILKDDIDAPYSMMHEIVYWLQSKHTCCTDKDIIKRLVQFKDWCINCEEGSSAEDDIWSIFVVAFLEGLFKNEKTRILIPYLISRNELLQSRDYFTSWVGVKNYDEVLKLKFPQF